MTTSISRVIRQKVCNLLGAVVTQMLSIMPVLKVSDLQRSLRWYTDVLGFRNQGHSLDDEDGGL